jgi:5'-deoxynucleotidase YfbR-like HD superfamily hydrolase
MNLPLTLNSGGVLRFHAVPGMTKQTVAEHSWGVAVILIQILPEACGSVLRHALFHDIAEVETGDIPHPFKQKHLVINDYIKQEELNVFARYGIRQEWLTDRETHAIKIADCLDGMTYCVNRFQAGERAAAQPFETWMAFLEAYKPLETFPKAVEYLDHLKSEMLYEGRM